MRFFRALRFWIGQCRACGTGSPVAEMANMLSTTTPPLQRCASMRGTRGRRCGNDGTLGRSKRDPQACYDKGYLNCRFAWDYARTPICAGSGFHGPCLTRSMTLRLLQKGNISIEGRRIFPHSLGIFYQALSQYLGFPHYEQGDGPRGPGLVPGADGVGPARARQHGRSCAILGAVI
jgi:hypothetical protein